MDSKKILWWGLKALVIVVLLLLVLALVGQVRGEGPYSDDNWNLQYASYLPKNDWCFDWRWSQQSDGAMYRWIGINLGNTIEYWAWVFVKPVLRPEYDPELPDEVQYLLAQDDAAMADVTPQDPNDRYRHLTPAEKAKIGYNGWWSEQWPEVVATGVGFGGGVAAARARDSGEDESNVFNVTTDDGSPVTIGSGSAAGDDANPN